MRTSPLSILIIFIFTFFLCAIFLYSNSSRQSIPYKTTKNDRGRVLGVSEIVPTRLLELSDSGFNSLPNNNFLLPRKENEENERFSLSTGCGVVLDNISGFVLFNQEADKKVSIASITKLVTALVFLNHNPGWESIYQIRPQDRVEGGKIYLSTGEKVRLKDLFYLSLVGSANTATRALVNSTGMSEAEYVAKMNSKAEELGLENTNFVDSIGLSNANISTAREVAQLAQAAIANRNISEATLTKKYEFSTLGGKKKIVYNTDRLLDIFSQNGIKILGGKTGFTTSAGYCFVGKFKNADGYEIIAVILGSPDKNSRFQQIRELVEWVYDNYTWPEG